MAKFVEDFTGLNNGDISTQHGWQRVSGGNIHRTDVGVTRGYIYNTSASVYAQFNTYFNTPKVYCKLTFNFTNNYDGIDIGFGHHTTHQIHTGLFVNTESDYLFVQRVYEGNYGPWNEMYGAYTFGDTVTVEFMHDFTLGKFEYIKCDYLSAERTNDVGSGSSYQHCCGGIEPYSYTNPSDLFYIEYQSFPGKNLYLKFPKWQKTKYGMRPWY